MTPVTPQQQPSGPRCGEVSGAAAAALEQAEEGRLGADLEGEQLLHFGCHCCKSINVLICIKTPDGSWLLRRAEAAPTVADESEAALEEVPITLSITPPETPPTEYEIPPDDEVRDTETEETPAAEEQEDSPFHPTSKAVADPSISTDKKNSTEEAARDVRDEVAATADAPPTAPAVAIAAPTPKREGLKTAQVLRPLATNSTASTCSSLWESPDLRAGDEPPTPTPLRATPKENRSLAAGQQQRLHQKPQQTGQETRPKETPQQRQSHQQSKREPSAVISSPSSGRPEGIQQETHEVTRRESSSDRQQQQDQMSSPKAPSDIGDSEKETAALKARAAQQQKREEQQQQVTPPHAETKPKKPQPSSTKDSSNSNSDHSNNSGSVSNSNSNSSSNTQQDIIAEMASHMVTRECEGDGNCLYRAFSDQLYGSQDHHLFLRKLAVDVMSRCQGTFEAFVDESEGPFDRWLQTKRTYGEWADYREMHALLLLFGTPIFVFDERLQLLQTFEPEAEKRRPPNPNGEPLTPFRLMWHGKLGHYTSLHYVKEGFPIARGLTIGELEAEGLARLTLSLVSGGASAATASESGSPGSPETSPPAGVEDEALAECLQVSAQELADLAAEQELILSAIRRQRLQQLLPQTTRIVDALWHESKKEQEAWTARLAKAPRGGPLPPSTRDPAQQEHNMPWRVIDRTAAATTATEGYAANVRTSQPPFRAVREALPGASCSISTAPYAASGGPSSGQPLQTERLAAGLGAEGPLGQGVRYATSTTQQPWQQQPRQQMVPTPLETVVHLSRAPTGPTAVSFPVRGPRGPTTTMRGGPMYRPEYLTHQEFLDRQHRQCIRVSDGRLMSLTPVGPLRHATLQQRPIETQQQLQGVTSLPASGAQRHGATTNSSSSPPEEISWLTRWMRSSNSQGR